MSIARRPFLTGLGGAAAATAVNTIASNATEQSSAAEGAEALKSIALPAPEIRGGKPVMEAFAVRSTSRDFAAGELPIQTLSNLLWAAFGVNRPEHGMRTAPSAMNWQETDIYVVMSSGAYVYDAANNSLKPVASGDLRALTGVQPYVKDAPVSLVYVADAKKMTMPADIPKPMKDAVEELKESMKWADSAVVAENAYIFAASEGLATGVRALIDRAALAKALNLGSDQSIMLAQCVGLPKR